MERLVVQKNGFTLLWQKIIIVSEGRKHWIKASTIKQWNLFHSASLNQFSFGFGPVLLLLAIMDRECLWSRYPSFKQTSFSLYQCPIFTNGPQPPLPLSPLNPRHLREAMPSSPLPHPTPPHPNFSHIVVNTLYWTGACLSRTAVLWTLCISPSYRLQAWQPCVINKELDMEPECCGL